MTIDLMNLDGWQVIIGMLGALGLSPAPWLLGLASNRLQFTKTARIDEALRIADLEKYHAGILAEKDKALEGMRESRNYYRDAHTVEVVAREKATAQLAEVGAEYAELTTHLLASLNEAAEGAKS